MRVPIHLSDRRQTDIAMTPMIDIVFQLMIFFICTASFQAPEELLPSHLAIASGSSSTPPTELEPELERIVVQATYAEGRASWVVNDRAAASLAEVREVLHAIAQIDRSLPIVLDVAGNVPLGDMIDVYDLCRLEQFDKIQFAAQRR